MAAAVRSFDAKQAIRTALDTCRGRGPCSLAFDESYDGLVVRCYAHDRILRV